MTMVAKTGLLIETLVIHISGIRSQLTVDSHVGESGGGASSAGSYERGDVSTAVALAFAGPDSGPPKASAKAADGSPRS